jgi:prevent-host-death family protein
MLNIYKDIHSLTDFKRRTSELLKDLQRTNRPIVLTVNGRPAVVVQDAEAYQLILDRLEELETFRRRSGLAEMRGGVC